nr:uncharacterized protein LOC116152581 [Camelus dromedarius]
MTPPGQPAGGARVRGGNRVSWFPGRPSPTCFKPSPARRPGPIGSSSTLGTAVCGRFWSYWPRPRLRGSWSARVPAPAGAAARLQNLPELNQPRGKVGERGKASPPPRPELGCQAPHPAGNSPEYSAAARAVARLRKGHAAGAPGLRSPRFGRFARPPRLCFGPGCAEPLRRLNAVGSRKPKALATRLVSPGTKPEVVAADLWAVTSSPSEQLARRFSIEVMRIRLVPRALQGPSPLSVPRRGVGGAIARRECLRATPKQEALLFQEHAEKIIDRMCLPALSAGLRPEEPLSPGHTELPPVAFRRLLGLDRAVLAPRPPRPQRALAVTVNWAFSEFLRGFSRPRGGLLLASLNCFSRPENPQKLHWQKEPSWHGVTAKASSSERVSFP